MYNLRMAESVTEGHPDKIADQLADALLDEFIKKDPYSKVSLEIMVTTGLVMVGGELTTESYVDIPRVVRSVIKDIGYTRPELGFDADTCAVVQSIDEQSPEIALGISSEGAGDTAIVVGYATKEAPNLMPWPITIAHKITKRISEYRKIGKFPFLRPDGKVLVAMIYEDGKPSYVQSIVAYVHHDPDVSINHLRELIIEEIIKKEIPEEFLTEKTSIKVNPTGRFVIGGPVADTGLTGRKIVSDAYGDIGLSGGSAFSGKDPTKTDRSGSYLARMIAKHVVAGGWAERCLVQIGYAFGLTEPVAFDIETFGTEKISKEILEDAVKKVFPLRPAEIIEFLDLRKPIYRQTSVYGHFGKENLPWEKLTKLEELKELLD
ncbi:methionine adenosyltransferase [Aquifex aeolicus]|uniref:S-adenosylmethionine synthase n=1 Tax=Aquifex aeolicus (strain VF5) TaxID=224324 RepID=METK_AQUAE|nr:methionine adenosyltransferase [Aquifex aeolicus]O67222.1 RecName: Full=S-adenosylmethionine synthase; Short=AdoMet synthase; AltName: Full=MAT; AltName: Full=Methionine adenosyltransferase [Aquifex aeolicus VF5]AAC07183.1 S-adenosylmethionine synthetase [Aquifex aeolicus VF5]